jgi:hypothetical protein
MSDQTAEDAKLIMALAKQLRRAPRVARLAGPTGAGSIDDVATEAAAGLVDIHRSCKVLSNELLPKLRSLSPESSEFEDVLDDIAEEYRHVHYHIANTRLFNYVVEGK